VFVDILSREKSILKNTLPFDFTVDKNPMHNINKLLVRNPIVTAEA